LASVSKQFTATAILQLVDKKQISLNDKLSRFFPDFPKGDSISIHLLLCHMSGLQMDYDELYLNKVAIKQEEVKSHVIQKDILNQHDALKYIEKKRFYFLLAQIPLIVILGTIYWLVLSKRYQIKAMPTI
jgi:hypothetical protein